jgi:hypothetical protein
VRLRVVLVDAAGPLSNFDDIDGTVAPPMYPKALGTEPWLAAAVEERLMEHIPLWAAAAGVRPPPPNPRTTTQTPHRHHTDRGCSSRGSLPPPPGSWCGEAGVWPSLATRRRRCSLKTEPCYG